jgi:hypothetical protein
MFDNVNVHIREHERSYLKAGTFVSESRNVHAGITKETLKINR